MEIVVDVFSGNVENISTRIKKFRKSIELHLIVIDGRLEEHGV